jgi:hypothetical protein
MAAEQGKRPLRVTLVALATSAALLAGAEGALAASASIAVTTADGRLDPAAYLPRVFTISGVADTGGRLFVKHRAAGGGGCAPNALTDSGEWLDASVYGAPVSGPFTFQRVLTFKKPGTWMFCFWLAPDETTITTPMTQTIAFRSPAGAIGATVRPATARPGQRAYVTVSGQSEAPRRVYAKVRAANGVPCAPSYDADPGEFMIDGWSVDGAYTINANTTQKARGRYVICMWLAGSSDDTLPAAGPVQQLFDVAPPPAAVSSVATLNCRSRTAVGRVQRAKVKSVCLRYRFSRTPVAGARVQVSYLTPANRTYKTVTSTWPGGRARTLITASLPGRAYKHRRGTWRVVLRVAGTQIKRSSFRVI